jgi:hypothetical protein
MIWPKWGNVNEKFLDYSSSLATEQKLLKLGQYSAVLGPPAALLDNHR